MIALFLHDDAKADLLTLRNHAPQAARRIAALLEQLEGDPDLLDRLTQHGYGAFRSADFHVSKWFEPWREGYDLWRLKVWELEDQQARYRIIYAFEPRKRHHHVLAVAPREFDYDKNHPVSQRVIRAYKKL